MLAFINFPSAAVLGALINGFPSKPLINQPTFGIIFDSPNNTCLHRGVPDVFKALTPFTERKVRNMKADTHPVYNEVIFFDSSCDFKFLTRTTAETKNKEKMKWTDGKEYPMIRIEVSSESHPFYTGKHKIMDTAGRIDKFKQRFTRSTAKPVEEKAAK
jgi:large subunit ribosomal protein L31